ncbi:DEAD/DEAH box helicase [Thermoleophilum album]|jgi:ATP-dependent RNA helicase DeaD|uniref:DEAD/DEAH box helicase n=1 Tax=Thermoleophilum album TaxID=29539 RepID=UPI00237CFBED|nr:DEAD/DEAH box helicase [Thermoleophilum album]WDT93833.1 DEAD/DEAH box helicase [Thermoleophilum album]
MGGASEFARLGLEDTIVRALERLGYGPPTPIQERAIPHLLAGRDVIGQAQTGTGKTAAFGLPLVQYVDPADDAVQGLVLTPTRELCIQVTQALRAYGELRGVEVVALFGGVPVREQAVRLAGKAHIVVGTVGRVLDMIRRHHLLLTDARFVVLDEADEMLDLGFLDEVRAILKRAPQGRQTALFSATMPDEIRRLADDFMLEPVEIAVPAPTLAVDTVAQYRLDVDERDKPEALVRVLRAERPRQAIVFVRTKIGVDRLARRLADAGVRAKTLHGDMSQGARDGVMIAFKSGRERLLVATDVAARGLDITGVSHVVNYDIPNSPDIYVHRVGRTGRAGERGRAITLVTPRERRELQAIERHAGVTLAPWSPPRPPGARQEGMPETAASAGNGAPGRTAEDAPDVGPEGAHEPSARRGDRRRGRSRRRAKLAANGRRARLLLRGGRAHGVEPKDVIALLVDGGGLEHDDVGRVRVLELYSLCDVPGERADDVARAVVGRRLGSTVAAAEVLP